MISLGFCRLCAEVKNTAALVLVNKNENDPTIDLYDKILQCFQVQILSADILPKTICLECCAQTNFIYEFYLKVQKAQEFLRKIVCNPAVSNHNSDIYLDTCNSTYVNTIITESPTRSELILNNEIPEITDPDNSTFDDENDVNDYIKQEEFKDDSSTPTNNENIEVPETNSTFDDEIDPNDYIKQEEFKEEDSKAKSSKKLAWADFIWNCTKCSGEFETKEELKEHFQNEHADSPEYKCPKCSRVYKKFRLFGPHVKSHEKNYRCDVCGASFGYKKNLKRHLTDYHKLGPQFKGSCKICGKEFNNRNAHYNHTRNFHTPFEKKLRHECDICKKVLTTRCGLLSHRRTHDDPTKFNICEWCGVGFRLRNSLNHHVKAVHSQTTEDNYFSCSLCPSKFKHRMYLRRHIRSVHSDKRFECEICGKQFYKRTCYTQHLRKHTGERPFECKYCNKRFRLKSQIEIHTRQHTGEKPYCCTDCNHDFTDFSNYIKHMRRKHGVTSFKNVKKLRSTKN